jgi:hypothetical protein
MSSSPSVSDIAKLTKELARVKSWFCDAYVPDDWGPMVEPIQGRDFLYTGKDPFVGQRMELRLIAHSTMETNFCRLSGEVVEILPEPEYLRPQKEWQEEDDPAASLLYTEHLTDVFSRKKMPAQANVVAHRCGATPTGYRTYLPKEVWDAQPKKIKKRLKDLIREDYGAIRGQELVCEARLNFDFEGRPGVPFDIKDIWRFKVRFDDFKSNMWVLVNDSLENLGPDTRTSHWPFPPHGTPCTACKCCSLSMHFMVMQMH